MLDVIQAVVGVALLFVGLSFMLIGSIGLVRLPDFFSRTHAASMADTAGVVVALLGLAVLEGFTINSAKIGAAVVFLTLTNPVASHALARAATRHGYRPWRRKGEG